MFPNLFGGIPGLGTIFGGGTALPTVPMPTPRPQLPTGSPIFGGTQPMLPGSPQIGVGPGAPLGGNVPPMPGAYGSQMPTGFANNTNMILRSAANYFAHPEQGVGAIFGGAAQGNQEAIDQAQQAQGLSLAQQELNLRMQLAEDRMAQGAGLTNAQNATRDWALKNKEALGLPDTMDADTLDAALAQYPDLAGELFKRAGGFGEDQYKGAFREDITTPDGKVHTQLFDREGNLIKDLGAAPDQEGIVTEHVNPDGSISRTIVGGSGKGGSLTEQQSKDMVYAGVMTPSYRRLGAMESNGYRPSEKDLLAAQYGGTLGNYAVSPEGQEYLSHAEAFLGGWLRKTSGAALTDKEVMREYKKFFPMPGDDDATLGVKRQLRQFALESMYGGLPEGGRQRIEEMLKTMPDAPGVGGGGGTTGSAPSTLAKPKPLRLDDAGNAIGQ